MDRHALLLTRSFAPWPENPWDSEEIHCARRQLRQAERGWRSRGLEIDKQIMRHQHENDIDLTTYTLKRMIDSAKSSYLNMKIPEPSGKASLFRIVNSFLLKKLSLQLPVSAGILCAPIDDVLNLSLSTCLSRCFKSSLCDSSCEQTRSVA